MTAIWEALRDLILRILEPSVKSVSQAEMIHYLQTEIEKERKINSQLVNLISEIAKPSAVVAEREINIEDLKPIGGKTKPWNQMRQELEADSIKKYRERTNKPPASRAAAIEELEKELEVE